MISTILLLLIGGSWCTMLPLSPMTRMQAQGACESLGGSLVSVTDEDTNAALSRLLGKNRTAWLNGWTKPVEAMENYDDFATASQGLNMFGIPTGLAKGTGVVFESVFESVLEKWKELYSYDWAVVEYENMTTFEDLLALASPISDPNTTPLFQMYMLEIDRGSNMTAIYLNTTDSRWYTSRNNETRETVCDVMPPPPPAPSPQAPPVSRSGMLTPHPWMWVVVLAFGVVAAA